MIIINNFNCLYRPNGVMNAKHQCGGTGPGEEIVVNESALY